MMAFAPNKIAQTENFDAPIESDVLVVGGGLSGLPFAIALARTGIRVVVVDREPPPSMLEPRFDWRTTAISLGSRNILQSIGVWHHLEASASPISDIRVADAGSSLFVHYDHRVLGSDPFGWVIENHKFRAALFAAMADLPSLKHLAPTNAKRLDRGPDGVDAVLNDGRTIRARLLVAADGKNSGIRDSAGIETTGWDYPQASIVCNVEHERSHGGVAIEHFFPTGPFAILPLTGNRSSVVWSERIDLVEKYLALTDEQFDREIASRFGDWLGTTKVVSMREAYKLRFFVARTLIAQRLALIGEAGHLIHPIAGQGLNLGLRDIASLAELVIDSCRLGLDPGRASLLARYDAARRTDIRILAAVTDGLNRLFSNNIMPIAATRRLGLGLVNQMPGIKRPLMRHAMGIAGRQSTLA